MRSVIFICGPNAGMMDMWLPVVWQLKRKRLNLTFLCIFSTIKNAKDYGRTKSALIDISEETFTKFISPSPIGGFVGAGDVLKLMALIGKHEIIFNLLQQFFTKAIFGRHIANFLLRVGLRAARMLLNTFQGVFVNLSDYDGVVLSDMEMLQKKSAMPFFETWKSLQWHSLLHGINLQYEYDPRQGVPRLDVCPKKIKAFLFSSHEKKYYQNKYGINNEQMYVTGVPRHEQEWIKYIKNREMNKEGWTKSGYVFLISKGVSDRLPASRKKDYLISIREVICKELGLELVIKTHPKAEEESVYSEVFAGHEGVRWSIEGRHPFVLGANSIFAITFYSGVPLDLLAYEVPTIEYLNLLGIPEYDNSNSSRNEFGEPILYYQKEGFVLGASNADQLRYQARRIMADRISVVQDLIMNYKKTFPFLPNITNKMAEIIVDSLEDESHYKAA